MRYSLDSQDEMAKSRRRVNISFYLINRFEKVMQNVRGFYPLTGSLIRDLISTPINTRKTSRTITIPSPWLSFVFFHYHRYGVKNVGE